MSEVRPLVKEELCKRVVKIPMINDRKMTEVLALGEEIVRVISAYVQQSGRKGAFHRCISMRIGFFSGV